MKKLIFLCLISINAFAGATKEEQKFLDSVSTFGRNASMGAYAEINNQIAVDEKLVRFLLIHRCKSFLRNNNSMRLLNGDYFLALKKSINEINTLATSKLIPAKAKTFGEIVWLLAYRDSKSKNDPLLLSYSDIFKNLTLKDYIKSENGIQSDIYQNIRTDNRTGSELPNSLHNFKAILELNSIYTHAYTAALTLGFSKEFEVFDTYTQTPFFPSAFDRDQYIKLDSFFIKNWPLISQELTKNLKTDDLKKIELLSYSKISDAEATANISINDNFKKNWKYYIPPTTLKPQKYTIYAISKLLNQKKYSENVEDALKNEIPSLAERLQLEGMVNTIIRDNALSICNN